MKLRLAVIACATSRIVAAQLACAAIKSNVAASKWLSVAAISAAMKLPIAPANKWNHAAKAPEVLCTLNPFRMRITARKTTL